MKYFKENLKKIACYKDGKIWFSKDAEKKFFFFMTMVMLLIGIVYMISSS